MSERTDWAEHMAQEFLRYIDTNGTVPWAQGWVTDGVFPANPTTGAEYKGINSIILGIYQAARGYSTPYFCTFRQMTQAGGEFVKDAKGQGLPVVVWKPIVKEDDEGNVKRYGFWRSYTVFSVDLMEGIATPCSDRPEPFTPGEAVSRLESGYVNGPSIRWIESAQAYYTPATDQITLPNRGQFISELAYAETLAHELSHSTGHESRLNRDLKGFGCKQDYAKEELVAEISAAIVMQRMGLEPNIPAMADYVNGWRKAISTDPKIVLSAASKADRAARMVMGITDTKEEAA